MADPRLPRSAAGRHSPYLIVVVISIATFMEVMDTTIANVALRHIAGSLAASEDESTWVLTSYLVSNAIILPISGWLANVVGRKRFYMACVALFTVSSLMCGLSTSLAELLFFRVLQGIGGGGLAPSEQSMLADSFLPEKRGQAFAIYALTVIFAPAIGPALGGVLTDQASWHWVFLINVPVGLLSLTLVWFLVDEPPQIRKDREAMLAGGFKVDWVGFALVAIGFGALQIVLDRGERDDGFSSPLITAFTVLSIVCIAALVPWERRQRNPAVDLRLFAHRSFLISNGVMFVVGFVLLSTTQLIPQLTQSLYGYDATTAGLTLALGGLASLIGAPIAGALTGRVVQPKYFIAMALIGSGLALLNLSGFNPTVPFWHIALARAFQAVFLPFLFVPVTAASYVGLPADKSNEASALTNLMRNLGGSIGISLSTTLIAWRTQFHHARLGESISSYNPVYRSELGRVQTMFEHQGMAPATAASRALAWFGQQVETQAQLLSYLDVFYVIGVATLVLWPVSLLLRDVPKGEQIHGH